jgi:hypothetical protein
VLADGFGMLQKPVSQRTLTMVNVRNNAKIPNILHRRKDRQAEGKKSSLKKCSKFAFLNLRNITYKPTKLP